MNAKATPMPLDSILLGSQIVGPELPRTRGSAHLIVQGTLETQRNPSA